MRNIPKLVLIVDSAQSFAADAPLSMAIANWASLSGSTGALRADGYVTGGAVHPPSTIANATSIDIRIASSLTNRRGPHPRKLANYFTL